MSKPKIKLLILTKSYWGQSQGGAELQCMYLLEAAKKQEMELQYCFLSNGKHFEKNIFVDFFLINKKYIFTKCRSITFPYIISIYNKLKKSKPDFIYNRAGSALTGICVYFGKKHNIRTIFHIANDSDIDSNLQNNKDVTKIERFITNYGIKNADIVIAQTSYQSGLLLKNYGRIANSVVPNGHNVPSFVEKSYNKIKIVWIANWKTSKRPEVFVNMVKKGIWSKNIEFFMIGRTKGYEKLVQEAKELGINVVGEISNDAVNEFLQESHLLINTSIHEGFSNTFIQAWMRCVPVVSLSVDPDNILNNKGLGVCTETEENLLNETLRLIKTPDLLRDIGKKARKYSIKKFSLDNFTNLLSLITG